MSQPANRLVGDARGEADGGRRGERGIDAEVIMTCHFIIYLLLFRTFVFSSHPTMMEDGGLLLSATRSTLNQALQDRLR